MAVSWPPVIVPDWLLLRSVAWGQVAAYISISSGPQALGASLLAQLVKNLPAMQETPVRSLGREDPLEKGKATHSCILYSGLENAMDCMAHGVPKSRTWLSEFHFFRHWVFYTSANLIDLTGIFFSLGCLVLWHHHQALLVSIPSGL